MVPKRDRRCFGERQAAHPRGSDARTRSNARAVFTLCRSGRRRTFWGVGVLLIIAVGGCGSSARTTAPTSDYSVRYPSSWQRQTRLPRSAYLSFLAVGHSSAPGCPRPILLVRRQPRPGGTLAQAAALYNRFEQIRRPKRRVIAQPPVSVAGAKQAVLIKGEYPSQRTGGPTVRSFDLLALSDRNVAFHLFGSGCAADLPSKFLKKYVLSFNADTAH
jgi:hypothetical protein